MYLNRLRSALVQLGVVVEPLNESAPNDVPKAVEIVRAFADQLAETRLKELRYGKPSAALITALKDQQRAEADNESVRESQALTVCLAHQHAHTLLDHGDVALGARVAAMVDEAQYREKLWELYRALRRGDETCQ